MATATATAPFNKADWISFREARALIGCSHDTVTHLIADGVLGVRHIPRTKPRVNRAEVLALISRSSTKGSLGAAEG
jgi:hypothetical protein